MKFFRYQRSFLLISSILIIVGFFLPWISFKGRFANHMPIINGIYLLSKAYRFPKYGIFIFSVLFCIPLCSGMLAFSSYWKKINKMESILFIALSAFSSILFFLCVFLFPNSYEMKYFIKLLGFNLSLNVGMIMMVAGSIYYLYHAIHLIYKKNKISNSNLLLKLGMMGGFITGILFFLILKIFAPSFGWLILLYLIIFGLGIIATNILHGKQKTQSNSERIIIIGFLVSIIFLNTQYLLFNIFFLKQMNRIPMLESFIIIALIIHVQIGLIISAIFGIWNNIPFSKINSIFKRIFFQTEKA